ncbi:hypothetical protein DFH28DRAFT_1084992 [Melampsora americana]|nr:hypothetical protein DFH28DRAFT_1084992 [Melampsora americana]
MEIPRENSLELSLGINSDFENTGRTSSKPSNDSGWTQYIHEDPYRKVACKKQRSNTSILGMQEPAPNTSFDNVELKDLHSYRNHDHDSSLQRQGSTSNLSSGFDNRDKEKFLRSDTGKRKTLALAKPRRICLSERALMDDSTQGLTFDLHHIIGKNDQRTSSTKASPTKKVKDNETGARSSGADEQNRPNISKNTPSDQTSTNFEEEIHTSQSTPPGMENAQLNIEPVPIMICSSSSVNFTGQLITYGTNTDNDTVEISKKIWTNRNAFASCIFLIKSESQPSHVSFVGERCDLPNLQKPNLMIKRRSLLPCMLLLVYKKLDSLNAFFKNLLSITWKSDLLRGYLDTRLVSSQDVSTLKTWKTKSNTIMESGKTGSWPGNMLYDLETDIENETKFLQSHPITELFSSIEYNIRLFANLLSHDFAVKQPGTGIFSKLWPKLLRNSQMIMTGASKELNKELIELISIF